MPSLVVRRRCGATVGTPDGEGALASFEPHRGRAPAGWPFVRKPHPRWSGQALRGPARRYPRRYGRTLGVKGNPPSGISERPSATGVRLPGYCGNRTPERSGRPARPNWRSFTGIWRKRNASSRRAGRAAGTSAGLPLISSGMGPDAGGSGAEGAGRAPAARRADRALSRGRRGSGAPWRRTRGLR